MSTKPHECYSLWWNRNRHGRLNHRGGLGFWWKILLVVSSSSSSLSPWTWSSRSAHCRSKLVAPPIVVRAAFLSCPFDNHPTRRRTMSNNRFGSTTSTSGMGLFPTTDSRSSGQGLLEEEPSAAMCLPPLRRSSRIRGRENGDATARRTGVRLFQSQSDDYTEGKRKRGRGRGGSDDDDDDGNNNDKKSSFSLGVVVPPEETPSATTRATQSKSRIGRKGGDDAMPSIEINSDADVAVTGQPTTRRSQRGKTTATPSRGTKTQEKAIPVTPEPLPTSEEGDGDSEANQGKTIQTAKSPTKTTKSEPKKKSAPKRKTKTASKSKAKKKKAVDTATWPIPDGWRETYELVRELRRDKTAPCDFMGAEALVLPAPGDTATDEEYAKTARFQTLIALMLSSQTKDAMVGKAMENLRDTSDGSGGLTVASILAMDPEVLNTKIYSVGFRNNKTKYIKQVAGILHDEYNEDVPPTADEMIRNLPGVGPKMAYIVENICWDRQTGIGVDTHMHRLFPKLGWVSPNTKNPEHTRKQLESWLPQEFWGEVNLLWVGFGQEVQQEKQKALRKALQSSRPLEALRLLQSIDFDIVKEWELMESMSSSNPEEEIKMDFPWRDDKEREKMNEMIKELSR